MFLEVSLTSSTPLAKRRSYALDSIIPCSESAHSCYDLMMSLPLSLFCGPVTSTNLIKYFRKTVSKRDRPPMKAKGPLKPTSRLKSAPTKSPERLPMTTQNLYDGGVSLPAEVSSQATILFCSDLF